MFRKALLSLRPQKQFTRPLTSSPIAAARFQNGSKLLGSLDKLDKALSPASKPSDADVLRLTEGALSSPDAVRSVADRTTIYEKLLHILTSRYRLKEAHWLAKRMEEEKLPISELSKAQLLVLKLLQNASGGAEQGYVALTDIFTRKSFGDSDILQLSKSFGWKAAKAFHIPARFIRAYIDCQPKGYLPPPALVTMLVDFQTRAELLDEAYQTLREFKTEFAAGPAASNPFMAALSSGSDEPFLGKVMGLMQEENIGEDVSTFNALIARERAQKSHARVVAFYQVLREMHSTGSLSPDAVTFSHLFLAMATTYNKAVDTLTPRQIFRDMQIMHFHSPNGSLPSDFDAMYLDQAVLNDALLAFLTNTDYAAAAVTLRAFIYFGIPVNPKTYKRVLSHLALNIHLRKSWRKHFRATDEMAQVSRQPMDQKLVEHLLGIFKRGKARPGAKAMRYVVPTYDMIQGKKPIPSSARLDVIPLEDMMLEVIGIELITKERVIAANKLEESVQNVITRAVDALIVNDIPMRDWESGPRGRPRR